MNPSISSYNNKVPSIGKRVYIDDSARIIGDVHLSDDVSVWPMAVIRGDVNSIHIGASSNIQDGSVLHVTHDGPYTPGGQSLILGEGVTIGHKAVLHACNIGAYCLIGIGAILLDKVVVEDYVIIGAGSLIPPGKLLKTGYLYMGQPARQIRELTDDELAHLKYSAKHYRNLKDIYLDIT